MPVTPRSPPGTRRDLSRRSPFTSYLAALQSSGLHIVLDDTRTDVFAYYGKEQSWPVSRDSRWAGGTETRFEGVDGDQRFGGVELAISGKEVQIIGRAPSTPDATFMYAIDGGTTVQSAFGSSPPTSNTTSTEAFPYKQWASISLPQDSSSHRVFLSKLPVGTSIDYAVVSVHESVQVSKELAVMDDADGSLEWKGVWDEVKGEDISGEVAAYGGGVHVSREVGSEVKLSFIGSTVSLYTLSPPSFLSASFTLDGGSPQMRTYGSVSSSQTQNQSIMPNYLLYTLTGLSSSLHTLAVKLTENPSNSSLVLDYITYTPSFTSLAALASSGGDPAKYASSSSTSGDQTGGARGRTMSSGTLAGIIVGVLVVVTVLISCFCCRGKRQFVRRGWRNWRKGGRTTGEKSEKGDQNEKSSTDLTRKDSPDWAFRNPQASQFTSRTSLEMDLDLDISPRARERRHQERDRARSRNKARASESRGESSRGHGVNRGGSERSKHRTRGRASSEASGIGRERPNRNEGTNAGTPSGPNHSNAGSLSLDRGHSRSNLSGEGYEVLVAPATYLRSNPDGVATLSEVALGKRPAREFANDPRPNESDGQVPTILPVATQPPIPRTSTLESARAVKARTIVRRIEERFATVKMRRRIGNEDQKQMKWAKPILDAIAAEWWLGGEPDFQARIVSLSRKLNKEELRLARMAPERRALRRYRQRRTRATRESRECGRKERERDARVARVRRELREAYFVTEEGEVQQEKGRRSGARGKMKMRVGHSTRITRPIATKWRRRWRRMPRATAENADQDWLDEDSISEASHITPFPASTNSATPFTAMEPSSSALASRLKDNSMGQEKMANALTPFTTTQSSSSSPKWREAMGQDRMVNTLTPFTAMQPPSASPSKDGKGKGKMESALTPFTAMEPSTPRPKLKDVKSTPTEGGLRPFMLLRPHPQTLPSRKRDERASHPPSAPFPRQPSRQSLPEISTYSTGPPISPGDPNIQPSPLALQSQLSALIDEINAQHELGQIPSPERLEEMVRLGRVIEESVKEIEKRGTGDGILPPPYNAPDDVDEDEDDERIGIAL